jgi:hypothetical protein
LRRMNSAAERPRARPSAGPDPWLIVR